MNIPSNVLKENPGAMTILSGFPPKACSSDDNTPLSSIFSNNDALRVVVESAKMKIDTSNSNRNSNSSSYNERKTRGIQIDFKELHRLAEEQKRQEEKGRKKSKPKAIPSPSVTNQGGRIHTLSFPTSSLSFGTPSGAKKRSVSNVYISKDGEIVRLNSESDLTRSNKIRRKSTSSKMQTAGSKHDISDHLISATQGAVGKRSKVLLI